MSHISRVKVVTLEVFASVSHLETTDWFSLKSLTAATLQLPLSSHSLTTHRAENASVASFCFTKVPPHLSHSAVIMSVLSNPHKLTLSLILCSYISIVMMQSMKALLLHFLSSSTKNQHKLKCFFVNIFKDKSSL